MNEELIKEVTEKAEPVVKEVVHISYSFGRKVGLYLAGIVTGVAGTKLVQKISKKKIKADKNFYSTENAEEGTFREVEQENSEEEAPTE